MKTILVAAIAVLIATPVLAQTKSDKTKAPAKKSGQIIVSGQEQRRAYSANPEHDVYFRGEYVGSDPDPRIRWTLRDEARRSYGLNN